MREPQALISTEQLARSLGQPDLQALRLHDLSRADAGRQRRALHRRVRPQDVRGGAHPRRRLPRPAGRVLRHRHAAALHDAGDRAARGRVRPPRPRQRRARRALQHRQHDVGDALLVDAASRSASTAPPCSTAASTSGRRKAGRSRAARRAAIRRPRSRRSRARACSSARTPCRPRSASRDTVTVNALGPQFHKGLEPSRYGRPGRVPGSVNVSAATLVDPATKGFTTLADAEAKFAAQGVTKDKQRRSAIAAAASPPPSTCSCCTSSATTSSRSTTPPWASGRRTNRCPSKPIDVPEAEVRWRQSWERPLQQRSR